MGAREPSAEHAPPAPDDWPRGYGEASLWPIATGVGVAGLYAGAALVLLGRGTSPLVDPVFGLPVLLSGLALCLAGLVGWTHHGFVTRYWSRARGRADAILWGVVLFLVTDVMTFAGGFVYYFYVRSGPWPPGELPALLTPVVAVNTAALLASSATMHLALRAIRAGRRRRLLGWLGATIVLGLLFVGGQLFEYAALLREDGFAATYADAFFALTGLHGLHVALGVVLLAAVFLRGLGGQFAADRHTAVAAVSMYWHFVDVVWVFLVATLYVGAVA